MTTASMQALIDDLKAGPLEPNEVRLSHEEIGDLLRDSYGDRFVEYSLVAESGSGGLIRRWMPNSSWP